MTGEIRQRGAAVLSVSAAENQITSKQFIQNSFVEHVAADGNDLCCRVDVENHSAEQFHFGLVLVQVAPSACMKSFMIRWRKKLGVDKNEFSHMSTSKNMRSRRTGAAASDDGDSCSIKSCSAVEAQQLGHATVRRFNDRIGDKADSLLFAR